MMMLAGRNCVPGSQSELSQVFLPSLKFTVSLTCDLGSVLHFIIHIIFSEEYL
jgi:hypothetical protein